ncbi:MAG: hypothetical protein ACXWRZ_16940, partial [Bdellovibrio sp.]
MLTIERHSLVIVGFFLMTGFAHAQTNISQAPLSETALFNRCYSQFTRSRALPNNALLAQVKSKQLTAVDACMKLLDKGKITTTGQVADTKDTEALKVQDTLYNFHRSWFLEQDFRDTPGTYTYGGEFRHMDSTEPALFLNYLLFKDIPYKQSVTGDYSVRGIRSTNGTSPTPYVTIAGVGYSKDVALTNLKSGNQRGALWGINAWSATEMSTWFDDLGKAVTSVTFDWGGGVHSPRRAYGKGGIIGLTSYIWMNTGFKGTGSYENLAVPESQIWVANGSIRTHRRWARNIMHDLLCRDLPVLRRTDVSNLVAEYNAAFSTFDKQLPFRANTVCMACHNTIDPMAATLRNFSFVTANNYPWSGQGTYQNPEDRTAWIHSHDVTEVVDPLPLHMTHRDADFSYRPPNGSLRYRSYDGTLNDIALSASTDNTSGITALGTALGA